MLFEILKIPWLGEDNVNGDFEMTSSEKIFVVRDFENIWKRTTWLEEQYVIRGSKNYLETRNLIRRRICYKRFQNKTWLEKECVVRDFKK